MRYMKSLPHLLRRHHFRLTIIILFVVLCCVFALIDINTCIIHAESPPLEIEQTAIVEYTDFGPRITYETIVTNQGTQPLGNMIITDVLPLDTVRAYFSDFGEGNWLSAQKKLENGQLLVLWLSEKPLSPGETSKLTYFVEIPWEDVKSPKLEKVLPVVRAEGWEESATLGAIDVTFDRTPPPQATPYPTSESRPTSTPVSTPIDTATAIPALTAAPTETSTKVVKPTSSPEQEMTPMSSPTPSSPKDSIEDRKAFPVFALTIAAIVILLILFILWSIMKKR